jgi:hypothetical protein
MRPIRFSAFICLCALGLFISNARGAGIPWGNTNGSSPGFFSWQNGNNETNLFGDPLPIGNTLVFFPSNFKAVSTGGTPDSKFDKINVDILADGAQNITEIRIHEIGDYSILGQGASASVVGTLVVTPIISNGVIPPSFNGLAINPAMPVTSGGAPWTGNASVTFSVANGVKKIHLTLDNILSATSDADSTATIDKKLTQGIIIEVIPEPATIGMLLCGAPMLLRRRRR